jgi:hypothetical protein
MTHREYAAAGSRDVEAQVKDVYMNEIHAEGGIDPSATIQMSVNSTVIVINGA